MAVDLNILLEEAETAYHRLLTGQAAVEFRDSNGEMVRYTAMNSSRLLAYILYLKKQLGIVTDIGPMRAWF